MRPTVSVTPVRAALAPADCGTCSAFHSAEGTSNRLGEFRGGDQSLRSVLLGASSRGGRAPARSDSGISAGLRIGAAEQQVILQAAQKSW